MRQYWEHLLISLLILGGLIWILGGSYLKFLAQKYYYEKTSETSQIRNLGPSVTESVIKLEGSYDGAVINYTERGFDKTETDITRPSCLLKIQNQSSQSLTLRLGPYELSRKSNYGQKYADIKPGDNMIMDPRYGRSREEYLNYQNPVQKFYVNIDSACQPAYQ